MRRTPPAIAAAVCSAAVCLVGTLAGCGSRSAASSTPAAVTEAPPIALATSGSAGGASWAVVRTGGPRVAGQFWQLLVRSAGSSIWRLATPPGVADNAGLVVAGATGGTLTVGFVPGQLLRFTPLATTRDDGAHWSQGLLPAGLVAAPSALTALPGGRLLAITATGAEESGRGGSGWTSLVTLRALAATPAGRSCGLAGLLAAAVTSSGDPLVAGSCSRPGRVDVFERSATGWTAHADTLRGPEAKQQVSVVKLASAGARTEVLLVAGSGRTQAVIQSWLSSRTGTLTTGVPLIMKGSPVTSTITAADGGSGVVMAGRVQFEAPAGGGGWYNSAPTALPGPEAVLALGSGLDRRASAPLTALVPGVSSVAVWKLDKYGKWHRTQLISIPAAPQ
jgi:hypothetical protein